MYPNPAFSPVSLSYVAALRGVKPRHPGEAFTYAAVDCREPDLLIALAASNPEGRFFGLIANKVDYARAVEQIRERQVENVTFINLTLREVLVKTETGSGPLPPLHYLCCDESTDVLTASDRAGLFDLAGKILLPGGLFGYSYKVASDDSGVLRFLVRELSPELNVEQASEVLGEIKKLGRAFLLDHPEIASKLDQAIATNIPDEFFASWDQGEARAASFDTVVAMRPRGFSYAGDGKISSNYIELSVPPEADRIIQESMKSPLYEPIKDFAINRKIRTDVWWRQPADETKVPAELFGGFSYGITMARDKVPTEMDAHGTIVPLSSPLYQKLIELMTLMPLSIGDFLGHPDGKGYDPSEVVGAIQILVAVGIARPMRGAWENENVESLTQPRLSGSFNQYLDKTSVMGSPVSFASPVLGDVMTVTARDALVMQAVDRAGLVNSASALLPELQRLARNPADAARVMDTVEPTAEMARDMIQEVLGRNMIQWYAYGLLEAA